jgi:hypothetical protein
MHTQRGESKGVKNSPKCLTLLSGLLLAKRGEAASPFSLDTRLEQVDFSELSALANSHHVLVRSFPALQQMAVTQHNVRMAESADDVLDAERARIQHALSFLEPICQTLREAGRVVVIKSLDHWPDLGNDLDLFTDAKATDFVALMGDRFHAKLAERSWGDRLANKWNFVVPGLPELVEIHAGRLGQTGEQVTITQSLLAHAHSKELGTRTFQVPAAEDRLIITTLQRMYRHFYIRLCDILDTAQLIQSARVDYGYLRSLAQSAGLWEGLATYLRIVSDYVRLYRGEGLPLPAIVTSAARFGSDVVCFRRNFIRIPLLPYSAGLYASELSRLLLNGDIRSTLRLSLLPGLATAAAVELKLSGSDKGIW